MSAFAVAEADVETPHRGRVYKEIEKDIREVVETAYTSAKALAVVAKNEAEKDRFASEVRRHCAHYKLSVRIVDKDAKTLYLWVRDRKVRGPRKNKDAEVEA